MEVRAPRIAVLLFLIPLVPTSRTAHLLLGSFDDFSCQPPCRCAIGFSPPPSSAERTSSPLALRRLEAWGGVDDLDKRERGSLLEQRSTGKGFALWPGRVSPCIQLTHRARRVIQLLRRARHRPTEQGQTRRRIQPRRRAHDSPGGARELSNNRTKRCFRRKFVVPSRRGVSPSRRNEGFRLVRPRSLFSQPVVCSEGRFVLPTLFLYFPNGR